MPVISGSTGNDPLNGTAGLDTLFGLAGNDTLFGSALADVMDGGVDNDTANYGSSGEAVTVSLASGPGVGGDAEGDTYVSIENLVGSGFADALTGNSGANRLEGLAGNDTLFGSALADVMDGGTDIDTVNYASSGSAVTVNLTSGPGLGGDAAGDTYVSIENLVGSGLADALTGNAGANRFDGGAGNDTLSGGDEADVLNGDADDDRLIGGAGNDTINGGTGFNTADYNSATAGVRVNLETGVTSGAAGADSISNIQALIGSEFDDSLTGDANDNILVGSTGADALRGGLGIDLADYSSAGGAVKVNLTLGTGQNSAAEGDQLSGIEDLNGSAFNDSLTGDGADNFLSGLGDNDSLQGAAGNDTLDGGEGSKDKLNGGTGDDLYIVDSMTDTIVESANNGGFDEVVSTATFTLALNVEVLNLLGSGNIDGTGNSGANILIGNSGNNALSGSTGNDSLSGGAGNDILNGGGDTDTMTGGDGDDSYFIDSLTDVISEAGTTGDDTVNSAVTWALATEFENLTLTGTTGASGTGNGSDNVINGNIGSNLLLGLGGNDSIVGDRTNDTLKGGNDTLDGGAGQNTLVGGLGNDTYLITQGLNLVVEQSLGGTDTVRTSLDYQLDSGVENLVLTGLDNLIGLGNILANVITGNDGNNDLAGGGENDTITGGIGNDTVDGGTGMDSMTGGVGNDEYFVDNEDDVVVEGSDIGVDTVNTSVSYALSSNVENLAASTAFGLIDLTGNTRDNILTGNLDANLLSGSSGADTLSGDEGNDTLDGGTGIDSLAGGGGDDLYIVDELLDLTIEFAGEGTDTVASNKNWTLANFVENLVLTGSSGLTGNGNNDENAITGTTGANLLTGLGGADTLNGGDGNDTLAGGMGSDTMIGGLGNDTYLLAAAPDTIVEAADEGIDTVRTNLTFVLAENFENLVLTGSDAIDGTGNGAANVINAADGVNVLSGEGGNDTIVAGAGDDTLDGGTGTDSLSGGTGADSYFVDSTDDTVVEVSARQIDTVFSTVTFTLASNVENLVLSGGAIDATGNSAANIISGTSGINVLMGLGGNDTMTGAGGADILDGGTGNDNMAGGNGSDTYMVNALADVVSEAGNAGRDLVLSSVNFTLGTNVEDLTLTGANRLNGTGNTDNNVILGNDGNNKLTGLEGNDTVTGGLGADRFIFLGTDSGSDTITDFNGLVSGVPDGDMLQFAASLLVGNLEYVGGAGFSGGSDNSEARMEAGHVFMDLDGNGATDITILLTGLLTEDQLVVENFIFA